MEEKDIEWIDTNEALKILRRSVIIKKRYKPNRPTLIAWVEKYKLGHKYMGRWCIDKNKFKYFIKRGNVKDYKEKGKY
jgi:hypothetical protein